MSAAETLRGLQVTFEHNGLRLVDVAATLPTLDGQAMRHARMIGVELAGIIGRLADRIDEEPGR
jgi:hypothetical protein